MTLEKCLSRNILPLGSILWADITVNDAVSCFVRLTCAIQLITETCKRVNIEGIKCLKMYLTSCAYHF